MFFKNLTLYRFAEGVITSAESLATAMEDQRLRDVGPLELSTLGFVSPFGRDSDALTHTVGPYTLLALGEQERILPSSVINDELADRLSTIHEREGRRVGGKERKRIKEEIISDFLPRAFVRTRRTLAYVDLANGWLVVDTSSRKVGEAFVSRIREAIGSFPAIPMAPMESPRVLMTDWLVNAKLPEHLALGEECELRDPAEAGAIVRARRQDLESDEVREHLKSGKQAYVLGLVYSEHLSFALAEDLTVKKLRFLDIVLDQLGEGTAESNYAELDATFALMTLELAHLLAYLEPLFGLAREPKLRLDGGDAPRHMRVRSHLSKLDDMVREQGITAEVIGPSGEVLGAFGDGDGDDPLLQDGINHVRASKRASISGLQRHLRIGYNRAAHLIEHMETRGIVSRPDNAGARTVLPTATTGEPA